MAIKTELLYFSAWAINIFFWLSLIPQVVLNFKLKSTKGLSDLLLIGYFVGYIANVYYVSCFYFPLAYKIMVPISSVTALIMIFQRFFYNQAYKKEKKLLAFYIVNGALALMLIPYAISNRFLIGNIAGWISIFVWGLYQLPQLFKIYFNKSVLGFSFLFITLIAVGELTEIIIALSFNLPIQTIVNGIRGLLFYSIFCMQFLRFS